MIPNPFINPIYLWNGCDTICGSILYTAMYPTLYLPPMKMATPLVETPTRSLFIWTDFNIFTCIWWYHYHMYLIHGSHNVYEHSYGLKGSAYFTPRLLHHQTNYDIKEITQCWALPIIWGTFDVSRTHCSFHIYQLTPRSAVLPEKLTVSQLVKKFPAFYHTPLPRSQNPATCPYPQFIVLTSIYTSVSQPLWDRGPVNYFFFTKRGPGPNKFTRNYLPIFLSSYIKLT